MVLDADAPGYFDSSTGAQPNSTAEGWMLIDHDVFELLAFRGTYGT
jgi:hypothetical protein